MQLQRLARHFVPQSFNFIVGLPPNLLEKLNNIGPVLSADLIKRHAIIVS